MATKPDFQFEILRFFIFELQTPQSDLSMHRILNNWLKTIFFLDSVNLKTYFSCENLSKI